VFQQVDAIVTDGTVEEQVLILERLTVPASEHCRSTVLYSRLAVRLIIIISIIITVLRTVSLLCVKDVKQVTFG